MGSFAEILELASDLKSKLRSANAVVEVGSPSHVLSPDAFGAQTQATRERTVVDTLLCDAIMGAKVDQTYDPVSQRVRFSPPVHEKWWGAFGVCGFWLEDKSHSVTFPNGALRQTASATMVTPLGPVVIRERIQADTYWYN